MRRCEHEADEFRLTGGARLGKNMFEICTRGRVRYAAFLGGIRQRLTPREAVGEARFRICEVKEFLNDERRGRTNVFWITDE